jgi:hypothetical protein
MTSSVRRESYRLKAPSKYTAKSQQGHCLASFDTTKLEQANREFFGSLNLLHIAVVLYKSVSNGYKHLASKAHNRFSLILPFMQVAARMSIA